MSRVWVFDAHPRYRRIGAPGVPGPFAPRLLTCLVPVVELIERRELRYGVTMQRYRPGA